MSDDKAKKLEQKMKAIGGKLKKFRYPALILAIGIALMLIPFRSGTESGTEEEIPQAVQETVSQEDYKTQTEQQLALILSKVQGAGKVSVMLTLKSGPQTVYQTDSALTSESADGNVSNTSTETTVILDKDDTGQEAAVTKTLYPAFLGAVVVCEGGDDATVRLNIVNAVASITGLSSEKITVIKMK